MCQKRGYRTADEAVQVMDRLIRRWNDGTLLDPCFAKRAYHCPDCGAFHLTKHGGRRNASDVYPTLPLPKEMSR